MKKLLAFVFALMPVVALGTTVCAVNNTYIGLFKKSVGGTVTTYSAANKTWKVTLTNGDDYTRVITGIAACNEVSGTVGTATTNLYTTTTDVGQHCWCKFDPVYDYGQESGIASYWVYHGVYLDGSSNPDPETCASSCTNACATDIATDATFRTSMFNAIW